MRGSKQHDPPSWARSTDGYLGIDEKSFRRSSDYVTVLNQLSPEACVMEVTEGRSQESGDAAFAR